MPSDFDLLQSATQASAAQRQAEARACEAFLNALYQALRHANGPGLPLNNVTFEPVSDPANRMRPVPLGGWHSGWLRLGLCEVYVRARRDGSHFVGEYGPRGTFRQADTDEHALLALARRLLRELAAELGGSEAGRGEVN